VQDPLNYGIKMNNRLAHLMVEQAAGDFPPTQQGEEVRQILTKMVDEELAKLRATIQQNTERINTAAREKGIEVIMTKKNPVVN
jgi:phosphoribosylaminoimidazole-succinocarboxamide synthase